MPLEVPRHEPTPHQRFLLRPLVNVDQSRADRALARAVQALLHVDFLLQLKALHERYLFTSRFFHSLGIQRFACDVIDSPLLIDAVGEEIRPPQLALLLMVVPLRITNRPRLEPDRDEVLADYQRELEIDE